MGKEIEGFDDTEFNTYVGMVGEPMVSPSPLESDTLRRFVQAIMDEDPLFYDVDFAKCTKFGGLVAPPLYPVHHFRRPPNIPDPLDALTLHHELDGTQGSESLTYGLPPIASPFQRLLNGGNEIEFFRCLRLGEKVKATARYVDVTRKNGKSGPLLIVVVETRFTTEDDELLLVNHQTLIWR